MRVFERWPIWGVVLLLQPACGDDAPVAQTQPSAAPSVDLFGGFEPARPTSPLQAAARGSEPQPDPSAAAPVSAPLTNPGAVTSAGPGGTRIYATTIATLVYAQPNRDAARLGYLRLGGSVQRGDRAVAGRGCKGQWYAVQPAGFVCTDDATVDSEEPLVRAAARRPDVNKPLPYPYGFVRATAPQYLRVPTHKEQVDSEFGLDEHLAWYAEHEVEVQRVTLGANDIPLDERGIALLGGRLPAGQRLSSELDSTQLLGGKPGRGEIPFWLQEGRAIPNISGFDVPSYALFADRVRRKTGLSFVDAFVAESEGTSRRFGVTVDLRLIPATKVKPDTGSPFHGIDLRAEPVQQPFAWVLKSDVSTHRLIKGRDETRPEAALPRRAIVPLSGEARIKAGERFYQVRRDPMSWLRASDIGIVAPPPQWPEAAEKGQKWIDISLLQQTLVLYEGKTAVYATLVSTGQDRLGDPETQKATVRGVFSIQSKHIAAAMDSEENSTVAGGHKAVRHLSLDDEARETVERLQQAQAAGKKLSSEDARRLANIEKGRHPEYGVTRRRGSANFELRDVPWIQYFAAGYALHGAYWHDVFGIPRSHGCVNLAPIDARYVFNWTEPQAPEGWHGLNAGPEFAAGTTVSIRE